MGCGTVCKCAKHGWHAQLPQCWEFHASRTHVYRNINFGDFSRPACRVRGWLSAMPAEPDTRRRKHMPCNLASCRAYASETLRAFPHPCADLCLKRSCPGVSGNLGEDINPGGQKGGGPCTARSDGSMPRTVSQMWETRRIELQCRCCLQRTCRVCTGVGHRKTHFVCHKNGSETY